MRRLTFVVGATVSALVLAACAGGSGGGSAASTAAEVGSPPAASFAPVTVTLLAHDSFAVSQKVLDAFTARTGITVKVVTGGDAGEVVNKAVLTAGHPEGDVLFGVDNTLLSRAVDARLFAPYRAQALGEVRPELAALVPGHAVTPIDYGDVCVNLDDRWFAAHGVVQPQTLADLTDPKYKGLLVVENPATSSPGLAFLLATIARYGDGGYLDYWKRLRANGVQVVNGWTEAYEGAFSGGSQGGAKPIVVSYASSPPAEIVYAKDPKPARPSTSVMTDGCFRQVEFAGVLRGTAHEQAARAVVDWMLTEAFQVDVPLSMFVFPARAGTPLPEVFQEFAATPKQPLTLPPADIAKNRQRWVDDWTSAVLR